MTYKHPATTTGWALTNAADTKTARTAISAERKQTFNVLDYISNPADTSTHTAGFQAAINAAVANMGGEVFVPSGYWYVQGLTLPTKSPLKFRGQASSSQSRLPKDGSTYSSALVRSGNIPIFNFVGPARAAGTASGSNTSQYYRDIIFEDITFKNFNAAATEPLLRMWHCTCFRFHRVAFQNTVQTDESCAHIEFKGTADTRFSDCFFLGGGNNITDTGAIRMLDGDAEYAPCNAIFFDNCDIEGYYGPGLEIGQATALGTGVLYPNECIFSNIKMESGDRIGPHIRIADCAAFYFTNVWVCFNVSDNKPIVDIGISYGVWGDILFIPNAALYRTTPPGLTGPSSMLKLGANASLIDLDVRMASSPPGNPTIVDMANTTDRQTNVRIQGQYRSVNASDKQMVSRWVDASTVFQTAGAGNTNCQYVFTKTGLNSWALGNPSNPSGTLQRMDFKAIDASGNTGTFLHLQSSDTNPSTSTRQVRVYGDLIVDGTATIGGSSFATLTGTETLSGKTLSVPKIDVLRDTATGSSVMQFGTNGTNGNYLYLQASSGNPSLSVVGTSGTDVSLTVAPKGAGNLAIFSTTGLTPTLEARGADADHNLGLLSKRYGKVLVNGAEAARRTVQSVATATTLGTNGDYVAFIGAGGSVVLPSLTVPGVAGATVNNTGRYTLKNVSGSQINISTTSSQTIEGLSPPFALPDGDSIDLISDGNTWRAI